jgi:probable F420-dependent oxidoreductase
MLFDVMNAPRVTMAQLEDVFGILRRLWHGEAVMGHDGPAGRYPYLNQDPSFDEDIPLLLVALGEKTLEFAGRVADAVVLHTFFTDDTTQRCVRAVRTAAEQAGRDPSSVRIWSCYATVHDGLPEPLRLKKTVGRLATYLQGYGDVLVRVNGWDQSVREAFLADERVSSVGGALDAVATTDQLRSIQELLPEEWLAAAATGTAEECARTVLGQFDCGADSVILHGATPDELAPVVDAYRKLRPARRFDALPLNPGASPVFSARSS